MKKIFILILIIFLSTTISSCKNEENDFTYKSISINTMNIDLDDFYPGKSKSFIVDTNKYIEGTYDVIFETILVENKGLASFIKLAVVINDQSYSMYTNDVVNQTIEINQNLVSIIFNITLPTSAGNDAQGKSMKLDFKTIFKEKSST